MRKISIVLIALLLVASVGYAAAVGSDTLSFYGSIGLGTVSFGVTESTSNQPGTRVDLLSNDMKPDSTTPVEIGSWSYSGQNQVATTYTLTYTFGTLDATISGTTYSIAYELKEEGGTDYLASGDTTTFSVAAGAPTDGKKIYARLTSAGRTAALAAAAGSTYVDSISVALTTP
ncbi:MAG: hypothetical protein AB9828_00945 [Sphaerochaetaceae bacterium]